MTTQALPRYIIKGVGGSHAHGLAHKGSDYDYRGVFSYRTDAFWSLHPLRESIVVNTETEDETSHELNKWMKLAAAGNPDVLDIFGYEMFTSYFEPVWAPRLLALEHEILSDDRVRGAYLGYARGQFAALEKRGDSFESGMGSRTWKHAKHMFRLLETAEKILKGRGVVSKVDEPDWYTDCLPDMTITEMIDHFHRRYEAVNSLPVVIRERPNLDAINEYIYDYRKAH